MVIGKSGDKIFKNKKWSINLAGQFRTGIKVPNHGG